MWPFYLPSQSPLYTSDLIPSYLLQQIIPLSSLLPLIFTFSASTSFFSIAYRHTSKNKHNPSPKPLPLWSSLLSLLNFFHSLFTPEAQAPLPDFTLKVEPSDSLTSPSPWAPPRTSILRRLPRPVTCSFYSKWHSWISRTFFFVPNSSYLPSPFICLPPLDSEFFEEREFFVSPHCLAQCLKHSRHLINVYWLTISTFTFVSLTLPTY